MGCYLFVHFREKTTPDGEQIYFSISRDGFLWEAVNNGQPVLWAYYGDKGARDHTIIRDEANGRFYILATDLSLAYGMRNQYKSSWKMIGEKGSKNLSMWSSDNLTDWTEQTLVKVGSDEMGCVWAPDIIQDSSTGMFLLHWSSSHRDDGYVKKKIYYSKTSHFITYTQPAVLYEKEDSGVIDSAMYEEDGIYYLFVKSEGNPSKMILLSAECITGPFQRVAAFDAAMDSVEAKLYEAPTAAKLDDGRWCLFIDYYGVRGAGQGYVPFIADSLKKANFERAEKKFRFPYGFKHGTILKITEEEFERIAGFHFMRDDYSKY